MYGKGVFNMKTREEIIMLFVDVITENEKEKLTTLNDFQFALHMYGANSATVNALRHKLHIIGEKENLIKKLVKEMELI